MHPFKKLIDLPLCEAVPANPAEDYYRYYDLPAVQRGMYPMAAGQERVMVQTFTPHEVQGVVLMCHGYYDHVGIYGHLIRYLLARGLLVVTFDQPGHGLSTGQPAHIESFDEYVEVVNLVVKFAVRELNIAAPEHWVAQSMGGAVLMEYFAQSERVPVGDLVLFAPLVRPYAWWLNRWVFAAARRTIKQKKRVLTKNADNPEFLSFLSKDPLQADVLPVSWVQAMVNWSQRFATYPPSNIAPRIIQGQMDRTVDWQHNVVRLSALYPQAEWLMLPTGRHHLVNESAALRDTMFSWLDSNAFATTNSTQSKI